MRFRSLLLAACFFVLPVAAKAVRVDFFYEPGCEDCERIEQNLLPELEARFPGLCDVYSYDIGVESNFLYLLQLEDALGHAGPERAYLIVDHSVVFGSNPEPEDFFSAVSERLLKSSGGDAEQVKPADGLAEKRYDSFTVGAVLVAGLLDGINPCAISTLVFFISLLAVSNVRKHQLILLGVSYILASFLTYLALGFGLFRALHLFAGFKTVRSALEWGMAAVLLVLAVFSFRDAVRFHKTGRAADVTLQLSGGMKARIHRVMRKGLGIRSLVFGGIVIGVAVTVLESVCTGQVYVPTLVLILKGSTLMRARAWMLLLLYNVLFIMPLTAVFIAVYFGLQTESLLAWSKRNVTGSKILLGLFFVLMAALILWM